MTWIEKVMREYPEKTEREIIIATCPPDMIGTGKCPIDQDLTSPVEVEYASLCIDCWNREIPAGETL